MRLAHIKYAFFFLLAINLPVTVLAQYITGIGTRWSDDFSEWDILGESGGQIGQLKARWPSQESWTEWDYRLGEISGQIKQKWSNDPNEWEIRGQNEVVTARTVWKDNFREWRVSDNRIQVTIQRKYGNTIDEWELKTRSHGTLSVQTRWNGDPREWEVYDELDDTISLPVRMALIFVVLANSMPQ